MPQEQAGIMPLFCRFMSLVFWSSIGAMVLSAVPVLLWLLASRGTIEDTELEPMNASVVPNVNDSFYRVTNASRNRRWINDIVLHDTLAATNVTHPFFTNTWYRYAHYQAKSRGLSNCYVCSYMPVSSTHPRLTAIPMDASDSFCYLSYSNFGMGDPNRCSKQPVKKLTILRDDTSSAMYADYTRTTLFPFCFARNGTRKLGQIPGHNCNYTMGPECDTAHNSHTCAHVHTPGTNGTFNLAKGFWLCGYRLYTHLSPNWDGVCAPVHVTDHTYVVSTIPLSSRRKRESHTPLGFDPHDAIWGTDVPPEHKLWTTGQKVTLSLFPWAGVGKTLLRVETLDYRFKSFVNASFLAFTGLSGEVTNIRLMVLQNRMVLDLQTAAKGGVCAMVGASCCSFIPDNTADGQIIAEAVKNISRLRDAMNKDSLAGPDWFSTLLAGWRPLLVKIAITLVSVLLLLCCGIPILRRMVEGLVQSAFPSRHVRIAVPEMEIQPEVFMMHVFADSDDDSAQ